MADQTNISIDSSAVRDIVMRGIFDALGEEQRNLLIQEALGALLERKTVKQTYGRDETLPSPLEDAFRNAVVGIAREVVDEYLAQDDIRTAVRAKLFETISAKLNEQGDWIYDTIGSAAGDRIAQVLKGDL